MSQINGAIKEKNIRIFPEGKSPYAVIGSEPNDNRNPSEQGRVYPWGKAEVEKPEHCDFKQLRLDINMYYQELKAETDTMSILHVSQINSRTLDSRSRDMLKNIWQQHNTTIIMLGAMLSVVLSLILGLYLADSSSTYNFLPHSLSLSLSLTDINFFNNWFSE